MTEEIDIDIDDTADEDDPALEDDAEPTAADLDDVAVAAEPPVAGDVESIQEILQKQEDADDDPIIATITKDEKLESIETRVVPIQATEFTCKRCFLVKHRSQLADKKRT